jgi:CubicO group peptidase (beta-lactamase class C family)
MIRCVLLCGALLGCATALPEQRFNPAGAMGFDEPARRLDAIRATFPRLDALAAAAVEQRHIPQLALGVVVDGELFYARGDADSVFRIGSITKTFTALAVLKLRDEGQLELDAPAERYLPELSRVTYPTRDSPRITLRHLLTHTSGLPAIGSFSYAQAEHDVTEAEIVGTLGSIVLEAAPGTVYAYSNLGLGLVGLIVGRASGTTYREYLNREVLAPLGMRATYWSDGDVPAERLARAHRAGKEIPHWRLGAFEGAGGLYTSLRDLARYAAFQLDAYPPRDEADRGPVRRASVREGHSARADGVALAWHVTKLGVGHDGGTEGHSASLKLLPDRGIAVFVLSNETEEEAQAGELANAVIDVLSDVATPRRYEVTPQVTAAAKTLAQLYAAFDAGLYDRTFTASFRAAAGSTAVAELIERLRVRLGLCAGEQKISMTGARAARIFVRCERGELRYDIALTVDGLFADATATPLP